LVEEIIGYTFENSEGWSTKMIFI